MLAFISNLNQRFITITATHLPQKYKLWQQQYFYTTQHKLIESAVKYVKYVSNGSDEPNV